MNVNPYDEIIQNLYVGGEIASVKYGDQFDVIINCTPDVPFPPNCKKGFRIPVHDDPSMTEYMYQILKQYNVLEFINKEISAESRVLVHCHQGMQRSCAVIACYLIRYNNGLSPDNAIEYVKKRRPIAFYTGVNFRDTINRIWINT